MKKYPTKHTILKEIKTIDIEEFIKPIKLWKEEEYLGIWRQADLLQKFDSLKKLCLKLSQNKELNIRMGNNYVFYPNDETITLDIMKPSILSTLHEIGHSIHGDSELKACAFSIKLFSECFPKERERLEWKGHMLVLPE